MGRRPNQLILEFFERGPKLEDASNRYQHTCKSCGEKVGEAHRNLRFPRPQMSEKHGLIGATVPQGPYR